MQAFLYLCAGAAVLVTLTVFLACRPRKKKPAIPNTEVSWGDLGLGDLPDSHKTAVLRHLENGAFNSLWEACASYYVSNYPAMQAWAVKRFVVQHYPQKVVDGSNLSTLDGLWYLSNPSIWGMVSDDNNKLNMKLADAYVLLDGTRIEDDADEFLSVHSQLYGLSNIVWKPCNVDQATWDKGLA